MSYHIVQKIEINKKDKKVYITGADNNVYPRTPSKWACTYYDVMMKNEDFGKVERDILDAYTKGNFQAGRKNKYTRALKVLRNMPEYLKFDWKNNWNEYAKNEKDFPQEYADLLTKALKTPLPKEKYFISKKDDYGVDVFMKFRKNSRYCNFYHDKNKATRFDYEKEAETIRKIFLNSENWAIIKEK